jgi:hypothetical protein
MARRKSSRKAAPDTPPPAPVHTLPQWLAPASIAALAFALYANSLGNGFITDDQFQILSNPIVTGAQSLTSAFGSGVWSFLGYRGNYYRPLQFVIYGLIYRAFGPGPLAYHALMVLLHALNSVLVYFAARRLFSGSAGRAVAWIAAALFAAHSIHTEAVDWIAALPDVFTTTLTLTGLCAFAAEEASPNALQTAMHCALFLAALFTKETGAVAPVLYAAYQWLCRKRGNRAMYAGMLAVFAVYLGLRIHALGGLAPAQQTFFHLTAAVFALSAIVLAAHYCAALVWPAGLNFFHVFHPVQGVSAVLILALVALAALAWAAWHWRARQPLAAFALVWIAAPIVPALNISGVGQNVFAERYLYLPSVGFCVLAALGWQWLETSRPLWARLAACAVLVALSTTTIARNRDWKDDFTLLQITLKQSPDAGYLHNLMAGAWVQRDQFQRALEEQRLAVRYEPKSAVFRKNLGNILLGFDPAAAAREFQAAIAIQPGSAELHSDLALAYQTLGRAAEAAAEFAQASALAKTSAAGKPAH